jgi:hypothetical protein
MAHSHHLHREHQVSHRRVANILKDEPSGATKHAKSPAFSKVTSKTAAEDHNISGAPPKNRYARGGKVGTTNIIIATGEREGPKPPMPMAVPPGPPPGPPPGGPPMGPPPGMPMRASGGKVGGESTKGNLDGWSGRAKANSYAKGGKVGGGAETGVGRLGKASKHRGK